MNFFCKSIWKINFGKNFFRRLLVLRFDLWKPYFVFCVLGFEIGFDYISGMFGLTILNFRFIIWF